MRYFLILLLIIPFTACDLKEFKGPQTSEIRKVEQFSGIHIYGPFEVLVDADFGSGIELTAPEDAMEFIRTETRQGILKIELDAEGYREPEMRLIIPETALSEIEIYGSGGFKGDRISSKNIKLRVFGSGDIQIPVETRSLDLEISGSGDIELIGAAESARLGIRGSGDIDLSEISLQDATANISGSGDIKLRVENRLEASISGSGDIAYAGNPKEIKRSVSGSGDIRPLD
jgi:hypothetical protein